MVKGRHHDLAERDSRQWPFEVRYGQETRLETDVLVLGGGIGGANAAIAAARESADVIVVDKAPIQRSGTGGTGHDHWLEATTNPASKITPEEFVAKGGTVLMGPMRYICAKTSWDTLRDIEEIGLEVRDAHDDFAQAPFRDEKSKLLFAYDYVNRTSIRLFGGNYLKPTLAKELDRRNIRRVERVMTTRLLWEDVEGGRRVTGAMGVHMQTGELFIIRAKTVVVATGAVYGMWIYRNDVLGASSEFADPNSAGDGHAMAWLAGAETTMMERAGSRGSSGFINGQPAYGGAEYSNTLYPCTIVDADGKEIPWVDHEGNIIEKLEERTRPRDGDPFLTDFGNNPRTEQYTLIKDLGERIQAGEYRRPLYMDLPGMPQQERRVLWGLMIGNEGKSLHPVYNKYAKAGFDPDKDLMQATMMAPDRLGKSGPWWSGDGGSADRDSGIFGGAGGFLVDWDLRSTNIGRLYGAGYPIMAHGCSEAATSGRYAGRKAAQESRGISALSPLDDGQIETEKTRIYAALYRENGTIGWRELQAGLNRIVRDYLSDYKTERTLRMGMFWLESLKEQENEQVYVRNPHELARYLEVQSRIVVAEMYFAACLARVQSGETITSPTSAAPGSPPNGASCRCRPERTTARSPPDTSSPTTSCTSPS